MKKSQKVQSAIQSAAIFRCLDPVTGRCLGYGVKSDSGSQTYHVTARKVAGEWQYGCTCPATRECKHVRAVKEVVAARKAMQEEATGAASYDVVAQAVAVVEAAENAALDEAYVTRGTEIRAAWDELQSVPSYTSRFAEGRESFESGPIYGTCGHLHRNPDEECGACKSRMYR